jgi:cytochrome c-type biogenesis protein CcmF
MLPLLLAMPFGPLLAWKRGDLHAAAQRLIAAFAVGLIGVAGVYAIVDGGPVLAPFAVGLALFVMAGALTDVVERTQLFRIPRAAAFARARGLPRSAWGTAVAHFGVGVMLLGIAGETQWGAERIAAVKPGETIALRHYELKFDGLVPSTGPNYRELTAKLTVSRNGHVVGVLEPAKRIFAARQTTTSEAALLTRGFSQLYASVGDTEADGTTVLRVYHKPLVLLIWLGPLVMVLGGLLSLSDRRLRVGAPKPARAKVAAVQPAE